jgi:hypothetical protein
LACKFFEYIFEPPLAEQNSIFYGCGFHLFIGNLLWMLRARDASAETIFEEFSKFARDGNTKALDPGAMKPARPINPWFFTSWVIPLS